MARETVTLDHLSRGRLILAVGLGFLDDGGYAKVGEELESKVRAQLLDEALAILHGLWSGQPFSALNRVCVGKARRVRNTRRGRGLSSLENKRNDTGLPHPVKYARLVQEREGGSVEVWEAPPRTSRA